MQCSQIEMVAQHKQQGKMTRLLTGDGKDEVIHRKNENCEIKI